VNQINTDLLHEFALTGDGRAGEVPFDWYLGVLQVVDLCSLCFSCSERETLLVAYDDIDPCRLGWIYVEDSCYFAN